MILGHILCLAVTLLAIILPLVQSQDCNICGEGNSIQYPQGVVEFEYDGVARKNNCETWQEIVKNPVAISDDFCRNEMLNYTLIPCECTTADGKSVAETLQPPTSPEAAPASAPEGSGGSPANSPEATQSSDSNKNSTDDKRCLEDGNEKGRCSQPNATSSAKQALVTASKTFVCWGAAAALIGSLL